MSTEAYGLRLNGQLMSVATRQNKPGECVEVTHTLVLGAGDMPWIVEFKDIAEKASGTNTPWYNASYDTPVNNYVGELQVVRLEVDLELVLQPEPYVRMGVKVMGPNILEHSYHSVTEVLWKQLRTEYR